MSLALVGDTKGIWIQKLCQLPLIELYTFPPVLFHYCRPLSYLRNTWWNVIKEDMWRGSVSEETG